MKHAALGLVLLALASCGAGTPVYAHQAMSGWTYPIECCSDRDCAVIGGRTVRETPAGYVVTVQPGGHPMWGAERAAPLVVEFAYRKAKPSPDGKWHLCISPSGAPLCLFAIFGGT
jgi:hypothetical protein